MTTGLPANFTAPVIRLYHSDLKRTGESPYRSHCPRCESGFLLIYRDDENRLMRNDRCISCAQRVYYLDETINDEAPVEATPPPS